MVRNGHTYRDALTNQDVDFLLEVEAADKVHDALLALGYQCLYRSEDAANYVRAPICTDTHSTGI